CTWRMVKVNFSNCFLYCLLPGYVRYPGLLRHLMKSLLSTAAVNHLNISYGTHPEQIMDIYLPEGRNVTTTKVVILIHGGGWSGGTKESIGFLGPLFYFGLNPKPAVVNMAYRLGTIQSPGFPKQIDDIGAVI